MNFIDKIRDEMEVQMVLRQVYCDAIKKFPDGHLITKCRGNSRYEHYLCLSSDKPLQYLNKKDKELITLLQQKKEYEQRIDVLNNNIPLLEQAVKKCIPYDSFIQHYQGNPLPGASQNRFKSEELIYLTSAGIYVRSKGEAIIIDILWQNNIPFYYEKKLILLDESGHKVAVYPDITIELSRRELMIWEHNGMLANEDYRRRNNHKMELYFLNGYYQPKNLIVTADGPNGEFSIPDIYRIVNGLILPLL